MGDINVEVPVGSACTIVGDLVLRTQFLSQPDQSLLDPVVKRLLSSAICIDTSNFDPALHGPRWVDKDKSVFQRLDGHLLPNLYSEITALKFDIAMNEALGMKNVLRKDCKESITPGGKKVTYCSVYVPLERLYRMQWAELVTGR